MDASDYCRSENHGLAGPEGFRERFGMEPTYFYRMNEDLNLTPRADEGRGGTRGSGNPTHGGANHSGAVFNKTKIKLALEASFSTPQVRRQNETVLVFYFQSPSTTPAIYNNLVLQRIGCSRTTLPSIQ